MELIILIVLVLFAFIALAAIFNTQKKILEALKIKPKIEFPPAKEVNLSPVIEAIKNIRIPEAQKIEIPQAREGGINTEVLQEIATLMRVNQAEFQSGLEAFHKAIDKLLEQIPIGEKAADTQKEFIQKFEEAFLRVQEIAAEAMNENSLRLQEILTEILNKKAVESD
jgi:hypothetical protein